MYLSLFNLYSEQNIVHQNKVIVTICSETIYLDHMALFLSCFEDGLCKNNDSHIFSADIFEIPYISITADKKSYLQFLCMHLLIHAKFQHSFSFIRN